jgi:metallo-beta-lactamase family protein
MAAGARLMDVISRNFGGTNKDLAAFADQINALANKWDR